MIDGCLACYQSRLPDCVRFKEADGQVGKFFKDQSLGLLVVAHTLFVGQGGPIVDPVVMAFR